jgi:linoleoyl-CoA desaturase
MSTAKIRFVNPAEQDFHSTLKKRVEEYFIRNNISIKANGFMYFKTVFYLGTLIGLYVALLTGGFHIAVNFVLFALVGLFTAFIGVNICHDSIHGAYSRHKGVNKTMSVFFNLVGASDYMWSIMHNIVHHTYTNIQGHDEDIELVPILRMSPHQPYKKIMKYQHIYAFILYGFTTLSWVFFKDYKKFFQKQIGNYENKNHPKSEYFFLFFYKIAYYFLFIALPIMVLDMSWWQVLLGFVLLHLVEGFTLAIIFVLAHVVDGPEFPLPDEKGVIESNWAIHQLRTTSNFCTDNDFVSFICGGLNFQVEHHLFPKICHVHYKPLSRIVRSTAEEFGVPYFEQPKFFTAVGSHIRLLKKLGQPDLVLVKA